MFPANPPGVGALCRPPSLFTAGTVLHQDQSLWPHPMGTEQCLEVTRTRPSHRLVHC